MEALGADARGLLAHSHYGHKCFSCKRIPDRSGEEERDRDGDRDGLHEVAQDTVLGVLGL